MTCENCKKLEKKIAQIEQFAKQPFLSAPATEGQRLFCDGWYCDKKITCAKYTTKPVEKAAFWARKPVDTTCNHYEPIL